MDAQDQQQRDAWLHSLTTEQAAFHGLQQQEQQQREQALNEQLQALQQQLQQSQATQQQQRSQTASVSEETPNGLNETLQQWLQHTMMKDKHENRAGRPSKVLPELGVYEGSREGLDAWEDQARNKMSIDYSRCSEQTKLFAVWSKVGGRAAEQMTPWFKNHREDEGTTYKDLLQQLETIYGDPHREENARRQIYTLRQKGQSFQDFFAEFDRMLQLAGGDNWPDTAKIGLIENALNRELADRMVGRASGKETWREYVDLLVLVSNSMGRLVRPTATASTSSTNARGEMRGGAGRYKPHFTPTAARQPQASDGDRMDWELTGPSRAATVQRAKWVSADEIERRKTAKLCVRCGGSGHFIRNCQYQPPRLPKSMFVKPPEAKPLLEDDEVESGNEQLPP